MMEAHESAAKCVSISTKKTGDEGLQGYMVQTVLRWILFFSCQLPLAMHANKNKRLQRSIPQNGLQKKKRSPSMWTCCSAFASGE